MLTNSPEILFHQQDIEFKLEEPIRYKGWIVSCIQNELKEQGDINFIFCSDNYLHKMNVDYLDHDTLTDVITFPMSSERIAGDIFISVERTRENAVTFKVSEMEELARVMIHGVLHLIGYGDKTEEEVKVMREKEQFYLNQIFRK